MLVIEDFDRFVTPILTLARRRTAQREREYLSPLSLWERVRVRAFETESLENLCQN